MLTKETSASMRSFHEDEDGIAALEVVMLTAIAAVIVLALWFFGGKIVKWCMGLINKMLKIGSNTPEPTQLDLN